MDTATVVSSSSSLCCCTEVATEAGVGAASLFFCLEKKKMIQKHKGLRGMLPLRVSTTLRFLE